MRLAAIINLDSGSVPADAEALLTAEVEGQGHELDVMSVTGNRLESSCQLLNPKKMDGVIVWGGDGTIGHVLTTCATHDVPVLPLPGGTMNLLPKRIHGEAPTWDVSLRKALASASPVWLPAASINGRIFYVGALLGKLTQFAKTREHVRNGAIGEAIRTFADSDILDLETSLTLKSGKDAVAATAAGIFVPEGSDSELDVVSIDPDTIGDLAQIGIESLIGRWQDAEGVSRFLASNVEVTYAGEGRLPATLDGEPVKLELPISVCLNLKAAKVWSALTV